MTMSRACGRFVLAALMGFAIGVHEPALVASSPSSHLRVADPQVAALVANGVAESATFAGIVSQLESAPLLVFVRCRTRDQQTASAAGLGFLANTPTYRYVRIFIRCDLPTVVQAPLLAHEFQHALEVSNAPEIVDAATLRLHYQRIGYRSNADDRMQSFDTSAAIDVQRRVTIELGRTHPHTVARIAIEPHSWQ